MPTQKIREFVEAMPPDRQRRIEKRFQRTCSGTNRPTRDRIFLPKPGLVHDKR